MQKKIFVEATYKIVAQIKGHVLAHPQTAVVPVYLDPLVIPDPKAFREVLFAMLETTIKMGAAEAFIHRLKTETATKRSVGGTKWSVELVGGIEEQPLYLKGAKVGDFYQFLKGKKVMKWDEDKKERYPSIIYPNLQGQIIDRNMAIVKILHDQPVAANDDEVQKAA